ncbi:MAG TPA: adenylyltransferase/cytidyltransferase family protein [Candidatus Sulfotelmatobacter sp.]|nr:adenylyltransferase/cytidyltransferase family protein [Candidatus Sulfotelmatobacter sp.]
MAVVTQSELILQRSEWKRNGKRVVCAIGVFDLLHPGHVRLLEQARAAGDILVVGVQSDAYAREEKGPNRPVTPAAERAEILDALAAVDFVVVLNNEPADAFITRLAPDALAQGRAAGASKHAASEISAAQAAGVRVIQIPPEPGHSTSRLIERIKQLRA